MQLIGTILRTNIEIIFLPQAVIMENTLTAGELKRRGMAAIDDRLKHGPVHIYRRNQRAAVVLSEEHYQQLLATGGKSVPGMTSLEWLLTHPTNGKLTKRQVDRACGKCALGDCFPHRVQLGADHIFLARRQSVSTRGRLARSNVWLTV